MEKTNDDARLQLIQHGQIEMAKLYKQLIDGTVGHGEAKTRANVMGKLFLGVRLEIDHFNLISKMPLILPDYNESVKQITEQINKK